VTQPSDPHRDADALADWLAEVLATAAAGVARGPLRLRVERHTLPNGRELPSFEVRSRRYGTRVVVHVEPGL
jgi:hypothetical protein